MNPYRSRAGDDTTPTTELGDRTLQICGGREAPLQNEHENFVVITRDVFLRRGVAPRK
jgi:hypothetical protein